MEQLVSFLIQLVVAYYVLPLYEPSSRAVYVLLKRNPPVGFGFLEVVLFFVGACLAFVVAGLLLAGVAVLMGWPLRPNTPTGQVWGTLIALAVWRNFPNFLRRRPGRAPG